MRIRNTGFIITGNISNFLLLRDYGTVPYEWDQGKKGTILFLFNLISIG